jgi:hypothetical protein
MGQETLTERLTKKKAKQKGGGTKKHGRNSAKCKLYRTNRHRKNKLAKLTKHIRTHSTDPCATRAYNRLMNE